MVISKRSLSAVGSGRNVEAIEMAKKEGVDLKPHVIAGHEVEGIVRFTAERLNALILRIRKWRRKICHQIQWIDTMNSFPWPISRVQ